MCVNRHSFISFIRLMGMVLFACMFILSLPAHAKTSPEKAAELKQMFNEVLGGYQSQVSGGATMEYSGEVTVEERDFYYAVTLPHIAVLLADGSRTEIGIVAINALEGDTPETWKMTVALPTPIVYYAPDGSPFISIDIGSQNFAGVWHKKFKNFVKQKAQYQNVVISALSGECGTAVPCDVKVNDIKVVYDLVEGNNGRWSGPSKIVLEGLTTNLDKNGGSFSIGKMHMSGSVKDYSIEAALDYQEKIMAMNELYEEGSEEALSSAHVMGLYNMVADFFSTVWDGFDVKMSVEDVSFNDGGLTGGKGNFNLGKFAMGFAMDGFLSQNVGMKFGVSYDGFELPGVSEDLGVTAPTKSVLDLRINNLPFSRIVEMGRSSLQATVERPETAQMLGMQALMTLPQLMTEAGTNVEIKDSFFGNDNYDVNMNAVLTADVAAAKGLYGDGRVSIWGLQKLLGLANQQMSGSELSEDKKAKLMSIVQMATMLQMMGQQEQDQQGRDVLSYNFELTKDGRSLLNGGDINALMGGGEQPQQQEVHEQPVEEATPEQQDEGEVPADNNDYEQGMDAPSQDDAQKAHDEMHEEMPANDNMQDDVQDEMQQDAQEGWPE